MKTPVVEPAKASEVQSKPAKRAESTLLKDKKKTDTKTTKKRRYKAKKLVLNVS